MVLAVDSSVVAAGCNLYQVDKNGVKRPSRFGSFTFNERESRYSQPKLELYGLFRVFRKWRMYLVGVKRLVVEMDAKFIKGMLNSPDVQPNMTLNRWIEGILLFDFTLRHVPAKMFGGVDGLSRRRRGNESESESEEEGEERQKEEERPRLAESKVLLAMRDQINFTPHQRRGEAPGYRWVGMMLEGEADLEEREAEGDNGMELLMPRTYEEKEKEEIISKTPGRRPVAGWTNEQELEKVIDFLKDLKRPLGLEESDLWSFLTYARRFFLIEGNLYRRSKERLHQEGAVGSVLVAIGGERCRSMGKRVRRVPKVQRPKNRPAGRTVGPYPTISPFWGRPDEDAEIATEHVYHAGEGPSDGIPRGQTAPQSNDDVRSQFPIRKHHLPMGGHRGATDGQWSGVPVSGGGVDEEIRCEAHTDHPVQLTSEWSGRARSSLISTDAPENMWRPIELGEYIPLGIVGRPSDGSEGDRIFVVLPGTWIRAVTPCGGLQVNFRLERGT